MYKQTKLSFLNFSQGGNLQLEMPEKKSISDTAVTAT